MRRYPRATAVFVALNAVAATISTWEYGAANAIRAGLAYVLFALALKFMVLMMLHEKLFPFPGRIVPVVLAIAACAVGALFLVYPILDAACVDCGG